MPYIALTVSFDGGMARELDGEGGDHLVTDEREGTDSHGPQGGGTGGPFGNQKYPKNRRGNHGDRSMDGLVFTFFGFFSCKMLKQMIAHLVKLITEQTVKCLKNSKG